MSDVPNQNWAAFALQALNALGGLAPWVIITALAAYGLWYFQDLNQKNYQNLLDTSEKIRTDVRTDFNSANTALKETYQHVGALLETHINALKQSVEVNDQMNERIRSQQVALTKAQIDAETIKFEALLEKRTAEDARNRAQREVGIALKSKEAAEQEVAKLQSGLKDLKAEQTKVSERIREVQNNNQQIDLLLSEIKNIANSAQKTKIAKLERLLGRSQQKLDSIVSLGPILGALEVDPANLEYGQPVLLQPRMQEAVLEIDRLTGTEPFSLKAQTRQGEISIEKLFADMGLELEVRWSSVLPLDVIGPDRSFSIDELKAVKNKYIEKVDNSKWHFYVVVGGKFARNSNVFEIMFDAETRQGSAIFDGALDPKNNAFLGSPLATMMHALGHQLNLMHPFQAYGDTASVMSYPARWPHWSWDDVSAYSFDAFGRAHIRWAPEAYVRPGAGRSFDYGGKFPWNAVRNSVKHGTYAQFGLR